MTLAVGRLSDAASSKELGTMFAVTDRLALTAFHCIGDRGTGKVWSRRVLCTWSKGVSHATVQDGDHLNDVALLRFDRVLPCELEPIRLVRDVAEHTPFVAPGAPAEVQGVFVYAASGKITWPNARLQDETPVIQLACRDSAAGLSLYGLSGAPVLVGQPLKAVGVVRFNLPRDDRPDLARGASIYAAPSRVVLHRWPQLDSADTVDSVDLKALLRGLADRNSARDIVKIQVDLIQLLLIGGLGLHAQDLRYSPETRARDRVRIDVEAGSTVILARIDLRAIGVKAAEQELDGWLAACTQRTGQRYVGVLTDGAEWRVYHRVNASLQQVHPATLKIDPSMPNVHEVLSWLEALLATGRQIKPTPGEITRKLGASSPSYALDFAELSAIYEKFRDLPTVKVKRAMWAKLLTTASGTNFTDNDSLFVDHTLLVAMAEVIGHVVLDLQPEDPKYSAATIMSGELLARAQIGGVIEADFFDWIAHVSGGERFIKDLARRLTRFAWGEVQHDLMKVLYQSIIPQEIRFQLGEYYTPDWLAEEIVAACVDDPLSRRVLDASCGSGTFLFHAVRGYVAAAEAVGKPDPDIIREVGEHVMGFDVHPVAVTLARVTYLLAIGKSRLRAEDRPAFAVPVYLGDSLRWGQESTLWSDDSLKVPTHLDHETFINDADFATQPGRQLRFPDSLIANARSFDRLVNELADKATNRLRGSAVPSLTAILQRFKIDSGEDRLILEKTFKIMCELHDEERDHIWGYYVRNLARPVWLARPSNRIDVLVGNPPWLAYRYMTEKQKESFRAMNTARQLWVGTTVATNQDLSALFVARCIELYLRPGGRFGYVMPLGTLSRRQYTGFRTGYYPVRPEPVTVAFDRPWDLHQIKPAFFPQSVGVVFGRRQNTYTSPAPLNQLPEVWSGKFKTKTASRAEASASISRMVGEQSPTNLSSPYAGRFSQGATVVPRFLFLVDHGDSGPLGVGAGRQAVKSRRSAFEKKPWIDLPSLHGTVERDFIRPLYLGESILPFLCLQPFDAVIPWDGQRLLHGNDGRLDLYLGLAKWWRTAESIWNRNRSSERLSLIERLDYHHGLVQQFSSADHRVVYTASGMYLAAAIVSDPTAVIEHKLYWGPAASLDEARFLTAILNSTVLTMAVRPLQGRGEHNPRDFDKYVFQLPIPVYDANDAAHQHLVALAEQSEQVAVNVALPTVRFEAKRRRIREALAENGVAADIDAIVKTFFA